MIPARRWLGTLAAVAALSVPLSLLIGPSTAVTPARLWAAMVGGMAAPSSDDLDVLRTVLWQVRLPRVLTALLVGAALSGAGTALQAAFRNPLVDPFVLGLAPGAAFGAALALATGALPVHAAAFLGGGAAAGASYALGRGGGRESAVSTVLAGIMVGGLFTAGLTVLQFLADPFRLQTIVHWTMGNLHHADRAGLRVAAALAVPALAVLTAQGWRMNALALGDDEVRAVGLDPVRLRWSVLLPALLAASAAVALAGVIGLYGLVVPHAGRMLVGADHRRALPASMLLGGTALLWLDNLSRSVASFELPIGVFTMSLGAPAFLVLMRRARLGWEA